MELLLSEIRTPHVDLSQLAATRGPRHGKRLDDAGRYMVLVALILLSLVAAGCSERTVPAAPIPPFDPPRRVEPTSESLAVRIYLDATLSMEGFVRPPNGSFYTQLIQHLESTVVGGWKDARIAGFHKFGTRISSINREQFLHATRPEFYADEDVNRETHVDKVVSMADASHLTLLVTDLYQSDNDVTSLVMGLKEKYLLKDLAVGVIGIKSQFDGTVFDVGPDAESFAYKSSADPATFRPFYVILAGKAGDIYRYFEQLRLNLPFVSGENFVVFSSHLVDPLMSFEDATIESTERLAETDTFFPSGQPRSPSRQFLLQGRGTAIAGFVSAQTYGPLAYTMPFDPSQIRAEIEGWHDANEGWAGDKELPRSLKVDGAITFEDQFVLRVDLDPNLLPSDGVFAFRLTLRPDAAAFHQPAWFTAWSASPDGQNLGSRTVNLSQFLQGLWSATYEIHKPRLAIYEFYIGT